MHNKNRQPGLRKLDDHQLFSLTYLQRHCSGHHENYKTFKPFVENQISEYELYVQYINNIDINKPQL